MPLFFLICPHGFSSDWDQAVPSSLLSAKMSAIWGLALGVHGMYASNDRTSGPGSFTKKEAVLFSLPSVEVDLISTYHFRLGSLISYINN